jgi:hypothetical protein
MSAQTPNHRLAWPFDGTPYRYFTNVENAGATQTTAAGSWGDTVFVVDETYEEVVAERRTILGEYPRRSGRMPHMLAAEWDALLFVLEKLAAEHPQTAELQEVSPDRWRFRNAVTATVLEFGFGDDSALTTTPLRTAAAEIVEDLFLLDDRDGALRLDVIAATFTGSWSSSFSLGMSFTDLHGPVPRVHGSGMVARTERFIRALDPGEVVRRLNWSMYSSGALDSSLEAAHLRESGALERMRASGDFGGLRLRVELQHLTRLPRTGAVLFTIATQLAPLSQLAAVPEWRDQLADVLEELPADMAAYKNFLDDRQAVVTWLRSA